MRNVPNSSFGNLPISSPKCPSDIIHFCFSRAPTISVPKHFNKSFILNQKHKGWQEPQCCPGEAKVHFPQARAETMSLFLLLNPFPLGKLWFLLGSKVKGMSLTLISSLLLHFHTVYIYATHMWLIENGHKFFDTPLLRRWDLFPSSLTLGCPLLWPMDYGRTGAVPIPSPASERTGSFLLIFIES